MARRNEFDEKRDIGYADGEKASGLEDGAWQGRRTPGRVAIEHVKRTDYQQTRRRAKRKQLLVDSAFSALTDQRHGCGGMVFDRAVYRALYDCRCDLYGAV